MWPRGCPAPLAASAGRPHARPSCPRTPTRSARSPPPWRITCSRWRNNSGATPRLRRPTTAPTAPLGACAITGTGFPIDRQLTAEPAGLSRTTVNTYGSIATADYLLETFLRRPCCWWATAVPQDLLLWSTGNSTTSPGRRLCAISSIMPQKRNPVALEHARAIASKAWDRRRRFDGPQHAFRRHRGYRGRLATVGLQHDGRWRLARASPLLAGSGVR